MRKTQAVPGQLVHVWGVDPVSTGCPQVLPALVVRNGNQDIRATVKVFMAREGQKQGEDSRLPMGVRHVGIVWEKETSGYVEGLAKGPLRQKFTLNQSQTDEHGKRQLFAGRGFWNKWGH
jgi:hypothetical protein